MKAILNIGFYSFLFPDEGAAARALAIMAKALPVKDHLYKGELEPEDNIEFSMRVINKPFKLVNEAGEKIVEKPAKRLKELPQARLLQLEDRTRQ